MTANNGWSGKPGIPLNPEQDGWHWLEDTVDGLGTGHIEVVYYAAWSVPTWYRAGNRSPIKKPENWIYLGPVLLPDEAAALAARVAELEAALAAAARLLRQAGEQFSEYAKQHAAKGTADGDQKAATNQQWAERCFSAYWAANDTAEGGKDE